MWHCTENNKNDLIELVQITFVPTGIFWHIGMVMGWQSMLILVFPAGIGSFADEKIPEGTGKGTCVGTEGKNVKHV